MTTSQPAVITCVAGVEDRREVNRVLAAAFLEDPVFAWIFSDRASLERALEPCFDIYAEAFARHEQTRLVTTDGRVAGVAMWAPPGAAPVHPDDEGRLDERVAELLGDDELGRLGQLVEAFGAFHPEEPCWYLQFLGVDPVRQQCGFGSTLLRDVLAGADERGEAAYLEATTTRNRHLYERHGFVCVGDIALPDGPTAYAMWRPPATS
jgi:ribosomal protein S18 acetylase RimI-like enzyme